MTLTLTIGWATVCLVVNMVLWLALLLWPSKPLGAKDAMGVGLLVDGVIVALKFLGGIVGTLLIWLVYFALLHG